MRADRSATLTQQGAPLAGGDSTNARGPGRVLMTADAVGGVWRYTVDLVTALRGRGVDVTVAVMGPAPSAAQRAQLAGVAALEVGPYRLEWMDASWADVEAAGEWLLDLERRTRPDVIHLNGYCHAALRWQAPVLVVAHSCVRSWWRAVYGTEAPACFDRYRAEVSRGLACAQLVVAPTASMLAALHEEYEVAAPARVIPNGRRPSSASGDAARKEPFVFAAGRVWDEAKNIQALCSVASQLPWPVFLAGETWSPDGACAPTWCVRHLARLEEREIGAWYARAAVYALPARYEPFGLSVLEAAAAGCALVLGDIRSLRENWAGAAMFVPPDNRRALVAAIERLAFDSDAREALGARAERRAQQFTVEAMVDRYLDAYAHVGAGVGARR